jgi:phage terminase large subunit-like protein
MEFQKRFIRDIYEPHSVHSGRRLVRRAILSIARKNGKTALIAALVLVHLIGPEAIVNGEIYSAANDREQAAQVFKVAAQMVRADPELQGRLKVVDSTKSIACYANASFYKAISAEAGTKHGLNPSVVIFDELAQAKSRELYDVLDTGFGARAEPLFINISTQSNDPKHIMSQLVDDGLSGRDPTIVCHLYAVPDDEPDIFREKVWKLANPALGVFRSLEDLRAIARKAQRNPAEEPKFRNLFLNQRVSPVASLISRPEWKACEADIAFEDGEEVYLSLDLSSVNDLTALVMVNASWGEDRVAAWFWKPEDWLDEHSARDFGGGSQQYKQWRDKGFLETSPGRSISPEVVATRIAELHGRYKVRGLAYDRWRMNDLLREFDRIGLQAYAKTDEKVVGDGLPLVPWGQGFKDMAPAIDALELSVMERRLKQPGNQLLTWMMANAVVVFDPAGNRKLDKQKAKFRIDGAVTLSMNIGLKSREKRVEETSITDAEILSRGGFV